MTTTAPEQRVKKRTKPRKEIDIAEVERLASQGLSQEKIAISLGVDPSTLQSRIRENPEFPAAIARGRAQGERVVANALFDAAVRGHVEAAKFYLARRCDWRETVNNEVAGKDGAPLAIAVTISKDDAAL